MISKKSPPLIVLRTVAAALVYACGAATATPAVQDARLDAATGKFQMAMQQQNFFTILTSIEERLKNLDNIYSMQLSQTLETKLDQYSRRLEALDTKIVRLEALVMLNLDKISENISTKNFKDDMGRTNLFRKMDSVYEGINHRLGYMERKYETNMVKIQTKVDTTLIRLEKIEENMTTRDADIEAEISDAIFAIDDLKSTCTTMEEKLHNITSATFNITKDAYKFMQRANVDSRKAMNLLHDNIIENMKYMNNKTSRHFNTVEENNIMLKSMRSELKEDFNDYANKVADMNSYIWKNSDTIEDDLKRIETVVNNTKTEVQNGVRSLMVQIGKTSNKDNVISSGSISLDEINKNLKTNFHRILTNQDLFLESCHRLQMDESQIESEISAMLEKLIDMLEKRMASEKKDVKNLEKALKSHDARIGRNMYQINTNVISLFEKSTVHNEALSREVKKIVGDLDALFSFVQSTTTNSSIPTSISMEVIQEKLTNLENTLSVIVGIQTGPNWGLQPNSIKNFNEEIIQQIKRISTSLSLIELHINNTLNEDTFDEILKKISQKYHGNCSIWNNTVKSPDTEVKIDDNIRKNIEAIFGTNPDLEVAEKTNKTKCKPNLVENCGSQEKNLGVKKNNRKKKKKTPFIGLIDVRGDFKSDENLDYDNSGDNLESTTTDNAQDLTTEDISTTEAPTTVTLLIPTSFVQQNQTNDL